MLMNNQWRYLLKFFQQFTAEDETGGGSTSIQEVTTQGRCGEYGSFGCDVSDEDTRNGYTE